MLPELLVSLDLIFQDWGQSATLLEVNRTYHPISGEITSETVSTSLTVITGPAVSQLHPATAATLADHTHLFLVREQDLPSSVRLLQSEMLHNSQRYVVIRSDQSPFPGLLLLQVRQVV